MLVVRELNYSHYKNNHLLYTYLYGLTHYCNVEYLLHTI